MSILSSAKKIWSNRNNYGSNRSTSCIDYIVIHYTANNGDTAANNGNFFRNNNVGDSAHFFVDSNGVVNSEPINYEAWHCGYDPGGRYYHPACRNWNSIGIELCDDNSSGSIYPSAKTIANAVALTKELMKKYNVPASHVVRHYDVTHKLCPAYWSGSEKKNKLWQTEFKSKLTSQKAKLQSNAGLYKVAYKDPMGGASKAVKTLKKGTAVTVLSDDGCGWVKVKVGNTVGWMVGSHLGSSYNHSSYKTITIKSGTRVRRLDKSEKKFETDTRVKSSHKCRVICTIEKGKYKGCKYAKLLDSDSAGRSYYIF